MTAEDMPGKISGLSAGTPTKPFRASPSDCPMHPGEASPFRTAKTLSEIEYLGWPADHAPVILGGSGNSLLNHFIANALEVPVVVARRMRPSWERHRPGPRPRATLPRWSIGRRIVRDSFR